MKSLREDFASRIKRQSTLTVEESFAFAKRCSREIGSKEHAAEAREVIVRALEAHRLLPLATREIWESLVESAGLYQYLAPAQLTQASAIRREFHRSPYLEETYFHSEQNEISMQLHSGHSVVLSAPTSFGKSLLIEEVVASRRHHNIVIIQPTLALLDETRKKLSKYRDTYKLVVSTGELPSIHANIFLFTGERVVEYKHWGKVDFFIIDEFYKLSMERDDERAVSLNQAFNKLLKFTRAFYLLGPSVDSVPEEFTRRVDFEWRKSDFATVALDEIALTDENKLGVEEKRQILFELLDALEEPTLIYCSAPDRAVGLVADFLASDYKNQITRSEKAEAQANRVIRWLKRNIHPD